MCDYFIYCRTNVNLFKPKSDYYIAYNISH
jgi:hypothetical protein